jgi:hypothetical protein
MNSRKIIGRALSVLILNGFVLGIAAAQTQPSNEVQVQRQGEADLISLFEGCKPVAKPSCQARIVCTGMTSIHGNNPRAIQTAMRIAQGRANGALALYLGNKAKAIEEIKQLDKTYGKENAAGSQTQTEFGDLISSVNNRSAEQFIQGVAVIGGKVDLSTGTVAVVIGQGCESVAAAQAMTGKMQQGQAQQQSGSASGANPSADGAIGVGGPQIHFGAPGSMEQKPKNDF